MNNPFPDSRMHMPISKIVIFGHFEPPTPLKTHITSWTHVILICEHSLVIFFALLSHWYPKNALKPSKITIFQKRMHMHTKIRDRGVIRERVNNQKTEHIYAIKNLFFIRITEKSAFYIQNGSKTVQNHYKCPKKTNFVSKSHIPPYLLKIWLLA